MSNEPNGRPSLKEYLSEMHDDIKRVLTFVEAMEAAQLPERVDKVEARQDRWAGVAAGLGVILTTLCGLVLAHMAGLG